MKKNLILLFFFCSSFIRAQNVHDTIQEILNCKGNDSVILARLTAFGRNLKTKPSLSIEVLTQLKNFSEKVKGKRDQASANRKIGVLYGDLNNYDKAIEYTYKAMQICDEINDKMGMAFCCNNIANFYQSKGKLTGDTVYYNKAVSFHLKNIALRKELKDTNWLYMSYSNASIAYIHLQEFDKAIQILNLSYNHYKDKPSTIGALSMVNSNLGDAYIGKAHITGRTEYFRKALSYLNDLVNSYRKEKRIDEDFADALEKSGEIYYETEQYDRSLLNLTEAFEMYKEIGNNQGLSTASLRLAKLYEKKNDFKRSNEFYNLYVAHKDTVLNRLNKSNLEQMQMIYQSGQKDKEIEKLKSDKVVQDVQLDKQRTLTFATIGGLVLLAVIGVILARSYYSKRKANLKITLAYNNIEAKNRLITESIHYAKRLQNAILPPIDLLKSNLDQFFIFYSPRDIVSGDFYWFTEHKGNIYFAVADCTGHGVPGALMSMIGNTMLHEIIDQKDITEPGDILSALNTGITNALRQQNADIFAQDDGMDISLICMNAKDRTQVKYASANHSIFVKDSKGLKELQGDIYSIGGSLGSAGKSFTTFSYTAEPGSSFVLTTDGFADQFGGPTNSKFLITRLEELLLKTDLRTGNTGELIAKAFEDWKGEHLQTDDVLITGFSV